MLCKCIPFAAATLALGLLAAPASAAPTANLAPEAGAGTSAVEKAAYRRCWWHRGHRHCRWVHGYAYEPYGYGYGPGYYRPSFGLYFGGGHRHGWHGHRGWRGGHHHRHHRHRR